MVFKYWYSAAQRPELTATLPPKRRIFRPVLFVLRFRAAQRDMGMTDMAGTGGSATATAGMAGAGKGK
jgi:hypothetical protein